MLPDSPVVLGGGTLGLQWQCLGGGERGAAVDDRRQFRLGAGRDPSNGHAVQVALGPISRSGGVLDVPANARLHHHERNTNGILGGYLTVNGYQGLGGRQRQRHDRRPGEL